MQQVILPELGEGIEKAVVACWHYKLGDQVSVEDDIVEVVTDKATFNVPASSSGIIKQILAAAGEEVKIGSPLAVIEPLPHESSNR